MKKTIYSFAATMVAMLFGSSAFGASFDETIIGYTDPEHAIVLTEGETFTLPEITGSASYVNLAAHRFLAIEGNVLTAKSAGVGAFKANNSSGAYIATVPVFVKPAGRTIEDAYILKTAGGNTFNWSDSAKWVRVGVGLNSGYPDGRNDIAFIPFTASDTRVNVDGAYSLAALYCAHVIESTGVYKQYIQGSKSDGSASLTFYGSSGKNAKPATFMAVNMSTSNGGGDRLEFCPHGSGQSSKITFKVGSGTLDIDCGGPTDKIKSENDTMHFIRWYANSYGVYDVPEGCVLRFVNGIRYGSFGDDQIGSMMHIDVSSANIFTGSGEIELDSNSVVNFGNESLSSFSGTLRSQSLNYIYGSDWGNRRGGIVWGNNVNSPDSVLEINGFTTRDFNPKFGVGAWISGVWHSWSAGGHTMNGNGLPERGLALNGGLLGLCGVNRDGVDGAFTKRADGGYEALYRTREFQVGKGLSYLYNWVDEARTENGVISHFIAEKTVHADPCGTLYVSDGHFLKGGAFGTRRSETTFGNWSDFYVGYKGDPDYSKNIFPIVPWAIGNSDNNANYFWWLGVDANGNVVRNGDRTPVDRNAMLENQNAYVNGDINLSDNKTVNSILIRNRDKTKTLGADRKLTIRSGALGLEESGSAIGTQNEGGNNGTIVFNEQAFVFATSDSETNPNQIWAQIIAEKGLVCGYCGNLLLGGEQGGIKGELTVNNGTLQLGSTDGNDGCRLGVSEVRVIGGNSVLRINKDGALDGKTVRFECPGYISPKFKLQNAEPERCYKLYIDGQSIRSGTWGATGSGAVNIDDEHFSGPGVLVVQRDDIGIGFSMVFRP